MPDPCDQIMLYVKKKKRVIRECCDCLYDTFVIFIRVPENMFLNNRRDEVHCCYMAHSECVTALSYGLLHCVGS